MISINDFNKIKLPPYEPLGYYLKLGNNVLISAPHAVSQTRLNKIKWSEPHTFKLASILQEKTNCSVIIKTENLNDDANYYGNSNYRNKIASLIEQNKISYILDLHSLSKKRSQQINIGTNYGFNVVGNFTLLNRIIQIMEKHNFMVTKDFPFTAPEHTIAGFFSKNYRVFSLQFEINSNICSEEDLLNSLINALTEIINSINAYDKLKTNVWFSAPDSKVQVF